MLISLLGLLEDSVSDTSADELDWLKLVETLTLTEGSSGLAGSSLVVVGSSGGLPVSSFSSSSGLNSPKGILAR